MSAGKLTQFKADWRTVLAQGNGEFRINGTYDTLATGRRLRRIIERKAKKEAKR